MNNQQVEWGPLVPQVKFYKAVVGANKFELENSKFFKKQTWVWAPISGQLAVPAQADMAIFEGSLTSTSCHLPQPSEFHPAV